jgi:hypothetical protein
MDNFLTVGPVDLRLAKDQEQDDVMRHRLPTHAMEKSEYIPPSIDFACTKLLVRILFHQVLRWSR